MPSLSFALDSEAHAAKALQYSKIYKKWAFPLDSLERDDYLEMSQVDCPAVGSDTFNKSGDLLSNMIGDPEGRKLMKLEVYTPDYVRKLENKIVRHTKSQYKSDFYAFKVCHLAENLDVAAGDLYLAGKRAASKNFKGSALVIVSNNKVSSYKVTNKFQSSLQLINTTATGGDVAPCDIDLQDNKVHLSCFKGFQVIGNETVGSKMQHWLFSVNGGKIEKVWETVGKNKDL